MSDKAVERLRDWADNLVVTVEERRQQAILRACADMLRASTELQNAPRCICASRDPCLRCAIEFRFDEAVTKLQECANNE